MHRSAAVALAAFLLAACDDQGAPECPGEPVASFHFVGTRVAAGDPSIALDPVPATADCDAALGYPDSVDFYGTLSADAAGPAGALCRSPGPVLFGQRTGDRYLLEASAEGAVLGEACTGTCSAGLRLLVAGDVLREGGAAVSFAGVLVEVMSALPGSACGTCALPCAARYALTGTR